MILSHADILKILPHRYPFLFVDAVIELEPGKRAKGVKNVSANEAFFQGHFPGMPVMPGVIQVEALGQMGGILANFSVDFDPKTQIAFMASISEAKFRRVVQPGDRLELEVELIAMKHGVCKIKGIATVDGECCCECVLTAVIRSRIG